MTKFKVIFFFPQNSEENLFVLFVAIRVSKFILQPRVGREGEETRWMDGWMDGWRERRRRAKNVIKKKNENRENLNLN